MTSAPISLLGIAWYREDDYPSILDVMTDSHLLPRTFREWKKRAESTESQALREGKIVVRAVIDPKAFPGWCVVRGLNIDAKARTAFANEEAYRNGRS
jgi:hypothetical protein